MAEFKVTPSVLRQKANDLRSLNQKFNQEVENMTSTEQKLTQMWEGDARNEFHNAFVTDVQKMGQFHQNIELYAQALESSAQKYEDAEMKNVSTASTRNS